VFCCCQCIHYFFLNSLQVKLLTAVSPYSCVPLTDCVAVLMSVFWTVCFFCLLSACQLGNIRKKLCSVPNGGVSSLLICEFHCVQNRFCCPARLLGGLMKFLGRKLFFICRVLSFRWVLLSLSSEDVISMMQEDCSSGGVKP
jgi:hypothetical protein